MKLDELTSIIAQRDPLMANAVSMKAGYILERTPSAYPSKEQTDAVNAYLHSVLGKDSDVMSEKNCEHRRIATMQITINAIQALDHDQLNRLQNVLDHIAYYKDYFMPEQNHGLRR